MKIKHLLLITCLSFGFFIGCQSLESSSDQDIKVENIDLDILSIKTRPLSLGNIGMAYKLSDLKSGEARFSLPSEGEIELLSETIRLFYFEEQENTWFEIADSKYEEQSNEMVGYDLKPGLYTASGWSANPAENAIQRLVYDIANGLGPLLDKIHLDEDISDDQQSLDFRSALIQNWISYNVNLERITCETIPGGGCDSNCGRIRRKLSSCPVECPAPNCCECVEFTWPERILIPVSFLNIPEIRVPGPICPLGLSCPTNTDINKELIMPTIDVPDYQFMEELGMGSLIEDVVLRDHLNTLIEVTIGHEYPIPPPWPN